PSTVLNPALPSLCFIDTPPPHIYTLSLHDALPISDTADLVGRLRALDRRRGDGRMPAIMAVEVAQHLPHDLGRRIDDRALDDVRSEEHTSELQSHLNLVCRLLLEKKNKKNNNKNST